MKITLFNYAIYPYEFGYCVSEVGEVKKGNNAGKYTEANTKYPKDFVRAVEMVRENMKKKIECETLDEYILKLKELDQEFFAQLEASKHFFENLCTTFPK